MRTPRINGEYSRVSQLTSQYELLTRAHQTIIMREDAKALVELLSSGVKVRFRGYKGHADLNKRTIALPSEGPSRVSNLSGTMVGKLRVGIVLHELAHIRYGVGGHDGGFVEVLDQLLRISKGLW